MGDQITVGGEKLTINNDSKVNITVRTENPTQQKNQDILQGLSIETKRDVCMFVDGQEVKLPEGTNKLTRELIKELGIEDAKVIVLPKGVHIDAREFIDCKNLKEVVVNSDVHLDGQDNLSFHNPLKRLTINGNVNALAYVEGRGVDNIEELVVYGNVNLINIGSSNVRRLVVCGNVGMLQHCNGSFLLPPLDQITISGNLSALSSEFKEINREEGYSMGLVQLQTTSLHVDGDKPKELDNMLNTPLNAPERLQQELYRNSQKIRQKKFEGIFPRE